MVRTTYYLFNFAVLFVRANALEWAEVGGICYGDVANTLTNCGNRCPSGSPENSYSFYADWSDVQNASACERYCEKYNGDKGDGVCYGFQHPIPFGGPSRQWSLCQIWTKPVLGSEDYHGRVCKVPFGSVISMQMILDGVVREGLSHGTDDSIADTIRNKISKSISLPKDRVSVLSSILNSRIMGRFVLPVGTDPQPVLTTVKNMKPAMEIEIKKIVGLAQDLEVVAYDAWIWGNQTMLAKDKRFTSGAIGQFSLSSSFKALLAFVGLLASWPVMV